MDRTALVGASAVLVAALATVTGCVGTRPGEPIPAGSPPPASTANPTTSEAPRNDGAPNVEVPLDPSSFLDKPCSVLSRRQLADLGIVAPGRARTDGAIAEHVGPQCVWHAPPAVNSTIDVGFVIGNRRGLGALYAARDQQVYFEETKVQDYPAVFHDIVDLRDRGACNISVGISNTLSFRTSEFGELNASETCARAKSVANAVITTLKGVT